MRVVVIGGGIIGATIAHELAKEGADVTLLEQRYYTCLLYTSPSPRDGLLSRMPSSA